MLIQLSFVAVAMAFPITSHADVFKCVGNDGKVSYSSVKCGSSAQKVEQFYSAIPSAKTEAPVRPSQMNDLPPPVQNSTERPVVTGGHTLGHDAVELPVNKDGAGRDCSFEMGEVKSVQRAMKNWYPASMSGYWHDRLRMANKNLTNCRHYQDK